MTFILLRSLFAIFIFSSRLVSAQNSTVDIPSNSSIHWTNSNDTLPTYTFCLRYVVRVILLTRADPNIYGYALRFATGFYCDRRASDRCLLAIMILDYYNNGSMRADRSPKVVWMANSDHPVSDNSTLGVDPGRGLILRDVSGGGVNDWSTNTPGVGRMTLEADGNLVLFNRSGSIVWKSYDHPSDTLLIGQALREWQKLTSYHSQTNLRQGKFSVSIIRSSLTAYVRYKNPVAYLRFGPQDAIVVRNANLKQVQFNGRNISFLYNEGNVSIVGYKAISQFPLIPILSLDPDGGLRTYIWDSAGGWRKLESSLGDIDPCLLPLACGRYGVCTRGGCSCPMASDKLQYFAPYYPSSPNAGCEFVHGVKLNSTTTTSSRLVDFGTLSYFSYLDRTAAIGGLTELEACKHACEGNASCKAAFFRYGNSTSEGLCYLPTEILTIRGEPINGVRNNSLAFIKVETVFDTRRASHPSTSDADRSSRTMKIWKASAIAVSIVVFAAMLLLIILWTIRQKIRKKKDQFDQVFGVAMRFSYKELYLATEKFSVRLGRGGFGTVFKGALKDGTAIAVKRLDNIEQGTVEFAREMETMGSIHHINLVKLIGFCADDSNRLLVYEYMGNGSLDKWIFQEDQKEALDWNRRRKIIVDVAKGLAYLHEECSQKIAHLDVKPHNILLDDSLNARISDFGLARFIDRNQSSVFTGMRGTFGYLAPEWAYSRITEKADIYSFGIVILEVVSGRMNLDYSQDKPDVHLLGVLQRKARDDQIIDIVDKKIVDRYCHEEDILQMIRIAAWCLNEDQSKRPTMSTVVKFLEGTMEMEPSNDFRFPHVLVLTGAKTESSSECSSESCSC